MYYREAIDRSVEVYLALSAEFYLPILDGEDRVVLAHTDIPTRHGAGATLADDDTANLGRLPVRELDAQVFWLGVT